MPEMKTLRSAVPMALALCAVLSTGSYARESRSSASTPSVAAALIFDYNIPKQQVAADEIRAHVGYVWAASAPEQPGGLARHDHYVAWAQGWCPAKGLVPQGKCPQGGAPSYGWLKAHHPNWILWQVNKLGVPTRPAKSWVNPGPILDFTNPAVQHYWIAHYIGPYLNEGFDGIAWDNPLVYNAYGAAGHVDSHHRFVRQFSGSYLQMSWDEAQSQALGSLLHQARAVDSKASFSLNANFDCKYAPIAAWLAPMRYVDTIVDEEGYSSWGGRARYIPASPGPYGNNRWLDKTQAFIRLERGGKRLVLINQEPYPVHPYMTDKDTRAQADLEWALANYLLVRYRHTYFWFGGIQQYGYPIFQQSEESVDVGTATSNMTPDQGVYVRWFSKGMALVNPSPAGTITVTLQAGRYKNLYGQNVDRLTMGPGSGVVLVRRQ